MKDAEGRFLDRIYADGPEAVGTAVEEGITAEHFADPDLGKVWTYLADYADQHQMLPSVQDVCFETGAEWEPYEPEDSLLRLIDLLRQQRSYGLYKEALAKANKVAPYKPAEAWAIVNQGYEEASADKGAVLKPTNVHDNWSEWFDTYLADEEMVGIPTGFPTMDYATGGLQPEQLVTVIGVPKAGKGSSSETPVLTPQGWCPIGDLAPGDQVIGSAGRAVEVVAVRRWPDRPHMRVTTDDGGSVVVDAAHEWTVRPHGSSARVRTVETAEIARRIQMNNRFAYLPVVEPVEYGAQCALPLHPYLLGVLLGDGSLSQRTPGFCKPEPWLHQEVERLLPEGDERHWVQEQRGMASIVGGRTTAALRGLGLMGLRSWEKYVPSIYMHASVEDRALLLAGLLDTDGGVDRKSVTFCSTSQSLAEAVRSLVLSLGGTARIKSKPAPRHQGGVGRPAWVVVLRTGECPFRLPRKREQYFGRGAENPRPPTRRVVEVTPAGTGETVCIEVAAPDGLYVMEDYLVTHNSTLLLKMAHYINVVQGRRVYFATFEMSAEEQRRRLACMIAEVDFERFLQKRLAPLEVRRMGKALSQLQDVMPDFYFGSDITAGSTVGALTAQVRKFDPHVVIVDGVYLMDSEVKDAHGMDPKALTTLTRNLKRMAQRLQKPVVISHQALESRYSARVGLRTKDIGYASSFAQDSDVIFGIEPTENSMERKMSIMAARNAAKRQTMLAWDWETSTMEEIEGYSDLDLDELDDEPMVDDDAA